jgi:hypothetical protein
MKALLRNSILCLTLLAVLVSVPTRGAAHVPALPQHPECNLVVTEISGDTGAFTVAGSGTSSLLISAPNGIVSINVGSTINATVNVAPFPPLTADPVAVTASKIDPTLPASFTATAVERFGHTITISGMIDCPGQTHGCTRTQGYWKNHAEAWPVTSLTLGTVTYSQANLLSILTQPVEANGLVSLSHQLIAAKLNVEAGASAPASVAAAIAAADALIGGLVVPPVGGGSLSPSSTSKLTGILDEYNNGLAAGGPAHCD